MLDRVYLQTSSVLEEMLKSIDCSSFRLLEFLEWIIYLLFDTIYIKCYDFGKQGDGLAIQSYRWLFYQQESEHCDRVRYPGARAQLS